MEPRPQHTRPPAPSRQGVGRRLRPLRNDHGGCSADTAQVVRPGRALKVSSDYLRSEDAADVAVRTRNTRLLRDARQVEPSPAEHREAVFRGPEAFFEMHAGGDRR